MLFDVFCGRDVCSDLAEHTTVGWKVVNGRVTRHMTFRAW